MNAKKYGKKTLSGLSILMLVIVATAFTGRVTLVHADSLNLTFNGNIKTAGCTVDTNSKDIPVSLGNVAASQFKVVGDRAAATQFAIRLGNCPPGTTGASVTFDGQPDTNNTTVLGLDSGGAIGVGIELSDITGTKINLGKGSAYYGLVTGGDNLLSFSARYVATRVPVTAGAANSTAQFTVNYQ